MAFNFLTVADFVRIYPAFLSFNCLSEFAELLRLSLFLVSPFCFILKISIIKLCDELAKSDQKRRFFAFLNRFPMSYR